MRPVGAAAWWDVVPMRTVPLDAAPGTATGSAVGSLTGTAVGRADRLLPDDGSGRPGGTPEDLARLVGRVGWRPTSGPALLEDVAAAGVTGHGGAHVPVAAKWRRVLDGSGPLTVVGNGAESEPLSGKDAALLRSRPHLVLDGLAAAAEALGAEQAVLWLHGSDERTADAVARAIEERSGTSMDAVAPRLVLGPDHYLAGEASAITHALADGHPLPVTRRAPVPGAPRTVVHNVETLARLALVARDLPVPSTTLLTVLTPGGRVVREVPRDMSLREVVAGAGWGPPIGALLGGFGGTWASAADLALPADPLAVRAAGLDLGAGVVAPLPIGACPVAETATVLAYLASMSARQCGPCLFGLPAIADAVRRLADGDAGRGMQRRLVGDLDAVEGRGACHHPDGAVRLVRSLSRAFPEHVAAHARGAGCVSVPVLPVPVVGR